MKHDRLLKEILDNFCDFYGPPNGVKVFIADMLSNLLGFQKVQNLGHYLGVPLFHFRVTNNTMYFVVKKVRMKLQSWDVRQLSFFGRVTLS